MMRTQTFIHFLLVQVLFITGSHMAWGQKINPGDTLIIDGPGLDVGNYIIPVATGGYLTVGNFSGPSPGSYTGAVIKLGANRDTLWTRSYRENGGDNRAWSVSECANGDFMITGFTNSFKEASDDDVWLFRIDSEGKMLWETSFGGEGGDLAWDIKALADDTYLIAAQTGSKGAGNLDAWIIKVDGKGNLIWDKTFGGPGRERVFSITQGTQGELYATGIYKERRREDPIDVYTICVNSESGALIWEDYLDKGKDDTGHGLIFDKRGGVWVAGYTTSLGVGGQDGFLARYLDGEVTDFFTYGEAGMDRVMNVVHGSNNDLWLVGYSDSFGTDFDVWLTRTNYEGQRNQDYTMAIPGFDRGVHAYIDSNQAIVVGTANFQGSQNSGFLIWSFAF